MFMMSDSLKNFSLKSFSSLIFQLIKIALCLNPLLRAQQNKTVYSTVVGRFLWNRTAGLHLVAY